MIVISELFDIKYGNQFDFSKMDVSINQEEGINFISRSSQNNGFMAKVERFNEIDPFEPGLITVTMGGSYLLSSFVQPEHFYTAQNIKVLRAKIEMSIEEKLFYCVAIENNRFRYHSHSREANSTFDNLLVPDLKEIPKFIKKYAASIPFKKEPLNKKNIKLNIEDWKEFELSYIFDIYSSKDENLTDSIEVGNVPYISSTQSNNGIASFISNEATNENNCLTVARNGSVGSTFYQPLDFCASPDDIRIFKPKFVFNKFIGLFLSVLIEKEKYRYAYGRKFGTTRMKKTIIKLP
ncbi:MAG: restriction endonuclease subunit S, partial [Bdellovibrionaceae bacterium]|nr:restriction endonuclease subunit S [Pseudobdellovibrionaceae bacterium]